MRKQHNMKKKSFLNNSVGQNLHRVGNFPTYVLYFGVCYVCTSCTSYVTWHTNYVLGTDIYRSPIYLDDDVCPVNMSTYMIYLRETYDGR